MSNRVSPGQFILPALFLLVTAAPLLAGIAGALDPAARPLLVPESRRAGLLLASIGLAAAVALAGMVVSVLAASWLYGRPPRRWLGLVFLAAFIPPYLHSLAWMTVFDWLRQMLPWFPVTGWLPAWWVQTLAFLPFALALALVGFHTLMPSLVEAGRVLGPDRRAVLRVMLPLARPVLGIGCAALFLMSILDYSVPSLFQVTVYALEIHSEFSASGAAAGAAALAVPLVLVGLAVAGWALRLGRRAPSLARLQAPDATLVLPAELTILQQGSLAVLGLQLGVPLVALIAGAGSPADILAAIGAARAELTTTLATAVITGLAAVVFGVAVAERLVPGARGRGCWWVATILPLAVPAPLIGIGLIALWNRAWLPVYGSALMPVLAGLARFAPWAALIAAAALARLNPHWLEAAAILQPDRMANLARIKLPLLAPGLFAAFAVVVVLTAGELGATLLVAPPGQATLTMRIYGYLHYGAAENVAALGLVVLVLALAGELVVWRLLCHNRS